MCLTKSAQLPDQSPLHPHERLGSLDLQPFPPPRNISTPAWLRMFRRCASLPPLSCVSEVSEHGSRICNIFSNTRVHAPRCPREEWTLLCNATHSLIGYMTNAYQDRGGRGSQSPRSIVLNSICSSTTHRRMDARGQLILIFVIGYSPTSPSTVCIQYQLLFKCQPSYRDPLAT